MVVSFRESPKFHNSGEKIRISMKDSLKHLLPILKPKGSLSVNYKIKY